MPAYRLSKLARLDLIEIADYTVDAWGASQAERYLDGLVDCFDRLVQHPEMGRLCRGLGQDYRRVEHAKHVVFYRRVGDGVFIGRILHQRMLPDAKLFEES